MRVFMLEAPDELLEERRRKGHDRYDEMWEGVLHMVPPPSEWHQRFGSELFLVLAPIAKRRGLIATYETGLFRPGSQQTSYRTPDLIVTRPDQRTKAGAEGAEVVFELLSPGDESRDKLPFYEDLSVKEVFLIDPDTRAVELYVLRGAKLLPTAPASSGVLASAILGVSFHATTGPKLIVAWESGGATI